MTTANINPGTPDIQQVVAANVRAELARERWSGRRAASALGMSPMYINRRLSGDTPMDVNDLAMFSRLLGVPVGVFFETNEKAPTAMSGEGRMLPEMDSNHQPADSESAAEARELASVTELHPRRDDVEEIHEAVISSLVVNR